MPDVPPKKPYTEDMFKNDLDLTSKIIFNKTLPKEDLLMMLQKNIKKGEDAGIMSSKEALSFVKDRMEFFKKYAKENPMGPPPPKNFNIGGRVNFLEGGDTKYNAMVTEMYIKLGGKEGTGMDIDTFAQEYFKKFSTGGRVGLKEGLTPGQQGSMGPVFTTSDPKEAAKEVVKRLIKIDDAKIPLDKKLSIALQGVDGASIQGVIDFLGGELSFGAGKKGSDKGIGFNFYKQFSTGGRVNYNEGSLDPDTLKLRKRVEELMDDGYEFGDAVKEAVKELENG